MEWNNKVNEIIQTNRFWYTDTEANAAAEWLEPRKGILGQITFQKRGYKF